MSASASERITVVSTRTTCDTIMPMRGLDAVRWKYDDTRRLRFFALPTYSTSSSGPIMR